MPENMAIVLTRGKYINPLPLDISFPVILLPYSFKFQVLYGLPSFQALVEPPPSETDWIVFSLESMGYQPFQNLRVRPLIPFLLIIFYPQFISSRLPIDAATPMKLPIEVSKLPRIFCPNLLFPLHETVVLGEDKARVHYLSTVLRLKTGHYLRAFNGIDGEYLCHLSSPSSDKLSRSRKEKESIVFAEVVRKIKEKAEENQLKNFCLFFSPIKTKRMKYLLEKGTEIGVSEFQPIITQNTNEKLSQEDLRSFEATLTEASEQCERQTVPTLLPPLSLSSLLSSAPQQTPQELFICLERSSSRPLLSAVLGSDWQAGNCTSSRLGILVGPEGGFTQSEIDSMASLALENANGDGIQLDTTPQRRVHFVSLGKNVLRSETAATYVLSVLHAANTHTCFCPTEE